MADFFDRLGYTMGAGQSLEEFLVSEQDVMLAKYETLYESSLSNLEVMKDLYMSMILSMTFALVFAIVLPILTGNDPTATVAAVIVLFVFVQLGFYAMIRATSPYDPIWFHPDEARARRPEAVGVARSAAGSPSSSSGSRPPGCSGTARGSPDCSGSSTTCGSRCTSRCRSHHSLSPASSSAAKSRRSRPATASSLLHPGARGDRAPKQSTTTDVLTTLRDKNFGDLSPSIERLSTAGSTCGSAPRARGGAVHVRHTVVPHQKFSEMYLVGRQMGGDPKMLGELISKNMNAVNQLREQRGRRR